MSDAEDYFIFLKMALTFQEKLSFFLFFFFTWQVVC